MNKIIEFKNVDKFYENQQALKNINLVVREGEFVYITGHSGSGKSTLMKSIYREEKIDKGKLKVIDFKLQNLPDNKTYLLRQQVGIVFQDYKLLPNKTVYENISYALEVTDQDSSTFKDRIIEVLKFVNLLNKINAFPSELSGGEQQRVGIARALVNQPKIILADEPTGNLDPETTWSIMNILERINLNGTTVIMVTHNDTIVDTLKHRTIKIENGSIVSDTKDKEV